jgi:RNA polymerase sigma-70 factor (ECF subfamily)
LAADPIQWNRLACVFVLGSGNGKEASVTDAFRRDLIALVPKLRRFAASLVGQQQDADDLVQAACEKALRSASHFQPGTRMDSWMYRIIQNLWLDDRRRARTRGTVVDPDDAYLSDEGKAAQLPEDRMMLAHVRNAMTTLPDGQREVLSLIAIEGLSYKETAEVLDLPIGTVMSRLSRAREALLPKLGLSEGRRQ